MQISRDGSTSVLSQSSVTIPGALGPYLRLRLPAVLLSAWSCSGWTVIATAKLSSFSFATS
jgi:hypothetical protein